MNSILAALGWDASEAEKIAGDLPAGVSVQLINAGDALPPDAIGVIGGNDTIGDTAKAAAVLAERRRSLIILLAQSIDAREGIGMDSADRVLAMATRFGEAIELSELELSKLQRGALLHDIGKLHLSNDVLLSKAMLTHEEWELLRRHTVFGEEMVDAIEGMDDIAPLVRSHHENFDGTGYPDGIEHDAIPRLARVLRIVDVVSSMTSPRHYRDGMASMAEAIEHVKVESGHHFDPDLAEVFTAQVAPEFE